MAGMVARRTAGAQAVAPLPPPLWRHLLILAIAVAMASASSA